MKNLHQFFFVEMEPLTGLTAFKVVNEVNKLKFQVRILLFFPFLLS